MIMSEKQTYRSMEEKSEPRNERTNIQTTNLQISFLGLSEEALQIAVKRREVKSKGEKERLKKRKKVKSLSRVRSL